MAVPPELRNRGKTFRGIVADDQNGGCAEKYVPPHEKVRSRVRVGLPVTIATLTRGTAWLTMGINR
jgi:hypothetical protein